MRSDLSLNNIQLESSMILLILLLSDVPDNILIFMYTYSVCVCVSFPFILDIKFVGRTSRGHTQEEGHTGFLIHLLSAVRALIFLARRIQPFLSLVDHEVELCVLTI